ncbi:DNA binding protein [Fragilaria crotonensis]|nr:DNA binding protein [Fragilaria crotonensis]
MLVSMRLVVVQASRLCARFRRKSARSKDHQAVQRFLAVNRIVIRAVTHTCQRFPHQVREEALDFIRDVREKVIGENISLKYINTNMDQMPGKTLNEAGARTVNGRTSTSQTMRATVAVTVTASGEMLKPLVVFKGKPGACIETREFPTYPADNAYACQETAWMDERVMLMWVRTILKPFIDDCPVNIQPLLMLDSYKCYTTMASVAYWGA